ncbi:hypothetical protein Golax_007566, partial [Gossypium laxum]|nr:hypothetical protein [Gossypium laxum]
MANQLKERQCLVVATGFDIFTVSQTFSNAGWVIENRTALQKLSGLFELSSSSVDYFVVDDVIHRTVGPACVGSRAHNNVMKLKGCSNSCNVIVMKTLVGQKLKAVNKADVYGDKVEWGKANLFVPHIPKHLLVALNGNSVEATYQ